MKAPSQTAPPATQESPAFQYFPPDSTPSPGLQSSPPFTSTPTSPGLPPPTPHSKSPPIIISDEPIQPSSPAPSTNTVATDIYDVEDYMSQKEEEEPKKGKGHHFPIHLFINMDQEEVDEIPPEINGKKLYKIKKQRTNFVMIQEMTDTLL